MNYNNRTSQIIPQNEGGGLGRELMMSYLDAIQNPGGVVGSESDDWANELMARSKSQQQEKAWMRYAGGGAKGGPGGTGGGGGMMDAAVGQGLGNMMAGGSY